MVFVNLFEHGRHFLDSDLLARLVHSLVEFLDRDAPAAVGVEISEDRLQLLLRHCHRVRDEKKKKCAT